MRVLDPGHLYELSVLDSDGSEHLRFVKRNTPAIRYPGNNSAYAGTTSQQVILALLDRNKYVQRQFWCLENLGVEIALRFAFWLLEFRAARRHKKIPHLFFWTAVNQSVCIHCGHIRCGAAQKGQ